MKTKTLVLHHWEDVVFENRNKAYGAYMLRRAYSKRLILGCGITVALFAALFCALRLSHRNVSEIIPPYTPDGTRVIKLTPPPFFPKPPRHQVQPTQPRTSSAQIVVTKDPVVETKVDPVETFTATSDETGVGGAIEGSVDGTVIAPVEEPVVIKPEPIRDFAEVMPKYNGGAEEMMKFIQKKIRVPSSFRFLEEGGTVYVRFIIRPDGKVTDVEVVRGISKDCDKEAARVISMMPQWIAGMQNGTPVSVRMVLPIRFAKES